LKRHKKLSANSWRGDLGANIQEKVRQLIDMEALDNTLSELFAANSLEEAQSIIWNAVGKSLQ